MEKFKMTVHGRVQGVGFRYQTLACAKREGVHGRVWNNSDGSVTIQAQGEDLTTFTNLVRMGFEKMNFIKVDRLDIRLDTTAPDFSDFQVVYNHD